jgi:hypothetical protein
MLKRIGFNEPRKSMAIANQCKKLAALITQHTNSKGDSFHKTPIDGLEF